MDNRFFMDKESDGFKARFTREMKRYFLYVLFLTIFFCAFSTYKRLILGMYAIDYIHYGYSFFESLILAKIILLGQMFGLGERFHDKPLIYPTLYKTIVFSFFVMIFSVLERFVTGFIKGNSAFEVFQEVMSKGLDEILASVLIMFYMFILFFAFLEISRVLGKDKLFNLFFKKRD